jgi:hypothetical protein
MEASMSLRKFAVFFLIFTFCTPVFANPKKVAVLGFEVDAGLDTQLGKTATNTLRELAKKQGDWRLLPASEFEENKLLYCEEEDPQKCIPKIATNLQVDVLITGRVSKDSSQFKFTIFFYSNKTFQFSNVSLPQSKASTIPKALTEAWNNQFQPKVAKLEISCLEADAKVFVDNVFVMSTVPGANVIPSITPGPHQIVVKSKSGAEWKTSVNIKAGETTIVKVEFPVVKDPTPKDPIVKDPAPKDPIVKDPIVKDPDVTDPDTKDPGVTPPVDPPKKPEEPGKPMNLWKVGFWSTAATAIVLIGAGTFTGLQVKAYEDDKDQIMRADPINYAGKNDVCKSPTAEMKDTCDSGKAYAMYTNVLIAGGITLGLVSTFFMYKGYLQSEPEVGGQVTSGDESSVTFVPFFSNNGAGLSVGISF